MGAQHSTKLSSLRRAIRDNEAGLTEVELKSLEVSDKAVRKLAEALRKNKYLLSSSVCRLKVDVHTMVW